MEYAICCYWLGKYKEAIRVSDAILARGEIPEEFLETARKNRRSSLEAMR